MPDFGFVLAGLALMVLLLRWWARDGRPQEQIPGPQEARGVDLRRLEEIASVPLEEIIEAAEWRAEHRGESEPKVLADLDPSAWTIEPETRRSAPVLLDVVPDTSDFARALKDKCCDRIEFSTGGISAPGVIHVPAGIPADRAEALVAKLATGHRRLAVIEKGMEVKPLPVRQPGRYDDCNHEDADRQEIMGMGSSEPIKIVVTSCQECDSLARDKDRLRVLYQQINESFPPDSDGDVPEDLLRHLRNLVAEADRVHRRIRSARYAQQAAAERQAILTELRKDSTA